MAAAHRPKNRKRQEGGAPEGGTRCPKCGSKNLLVIGEGGDRTLSCLDCDYTEGVGT
ncbi:MAG: hypothetical protein KGI33_09950 [Thaumarchaeota archaeon]|nr:hypothetical protein [Nitrososphaerota archaeon]